MTDYAKWDRFAAALDSDSSSDDDAGNSQRPAMPPAREPLRNRGGGSRASDDGVTATPLELGIVGEKLSDTLRVEENHVGILRSQRRECEDVGALMDMLPQKTRHRVMVPVGRSAFYEGELVNTNTLVVKMDDGTALERTPQQTASILARRREDLTRQIGEAEGRIEGLRTSVSMLADTTAAAGNFVDIRATEDEDASIMAAPAHLGTAKRKAPVTDEEFDEMMRKLDALERLEEGGGAGTGAAPVLRAASRPSTDAAPPAPSEGAIAEKAGASSAPQPPMRKRMGDGRGSAFTGLIRERGASTTAPEGAASSEGAPKKKVSLFKQTFGA